MASPCLPAPSLLVAVLALAAVCSPIAVTASGAPAFTPIFNGRDLAGWKADGHVATWRVADGVLVGESDPAQTGSVLRTDASYGDFVLEFEARWSEGADSGVFLRTPALQMQLGPSISLKEERTCSFYTIPSEKYPAAGRAKDLTGVLRPGDWNRVRLEARGDTFTVWLNGRQVTRYVDARFAAKGPIGLQVHQQLTMKVEFREVRIQQLAP